MAINVAFQSALSDTGRIPRAMLLGEISFHGRFSLLRIEGHLNRYILEVLQPEVVSFLQGIRGAMFRQNNAFSHVAKTTLNFYSVQWMHFIPSSACPPDMSPTGHVWDFVDRRLVYDSRLAASKNEYWLHI